MKDLFGVTVFLDERIEWRPAISESCENCLDRERPISNTLCCCMALRRPVKWIYL